MYPIKYEQIVHTYTSRFDVDPYLVLAIIQVESGFEEGKNSNKGAIGPMQIMPDTAKWIAKKQVFRFKQWIIYISRRIILHWVVGIYNK